jgi:hypothetical protein
MPREPNFSFSDVRVEIVQARGAAWLRWLAQYHALLSVKSGEVASIR